MTNPAAEFQLESPRAGQALAVDLVAPQAGRPTVLYLHGLGSSQDGDKARFFRSRVAAEGLGFCSFDLPGHGRSGGAMRELTLSGAIAAAESVHRWLSERAAPPSLVLGSSFGALIGLWMAARAPQRVAALVGLAPSIGLRDGIDGGLGDEGLGRWRDGGVLRFEDSLGSLELGWEFYGDLEAWDGRDLADGYRIPSLLLQGMRDDRVSWRAVADFAGRCGARVELHLFADGDHRLTDRKETLWRMALDFWTHGGHLPAGRDS